MKWKTVAGFICLMFVVSLCSKEDEPQTQSPIEQAVADTPKNADGAGKKKTPAKQDFTKPPSFDPPMIKLWQPNFATNKICNPPSGECKTIPRDDFFCVREMDFDSNLKAERVIIEAGRSCKKWGENWVARQFKGSGKKPPKKNASMDEWNAYMEESKEHSEKIRAEIPERPYELESAVSSVVDFYMKKQIHISWLNGSTPNMSVPQFPDLICYSKNDRDKKSKFIDNIFQRCYEWGE